MVEQTVTRAKQIQEHLVSILGLKPGKWLLGYELVRRLKKETKNVIDENTFLGTPYLLDYKEKETLLLGVDPYPDE